MFSVCARFLCISVFIYFHPLPLLCLRAMCQVSQPSALTAPQTNIMTDKPLTERCDFIDLFSQFVYINNATLLMCHCSYYLRSVPSYVILLRGLAELTDLDFSQPIFLKHLLFWGNLMEIGCSLFLVSSWPSPHVHWALEQNRHSLGLGEDVHT